MTTSSSRPPGPRAQYHHGSLRQELLRQAELLLAEQGVDAFSLRELARRVGVSPAAPSHHFGDTTGLLVELAILGFEELARYLDAWEDKGGADPARRLTCQGEGYVQFALAYPARFKLMFRKEKLACGPGGADPRLQASGSAAFARLRTCVQRCLPEADEATVMTAALRAWSTVHGFAYLALDGQLALLAQDADVDAISRRYLGPVLQGLVSAAPAPAQAASPRQP
jgi:AcrR family transcriptional regulator